MAKQTINPGVAPTGAGGDTFRSGSAKLQENDNEIYNYLGDGTNLNKLGTAAFKNTGTQAGNVMEVGAFGLGIAGGSDAYYSNINIGDIPTGYYVISPAATGIPGAMGGGHLFAFGNPSYQTQIHKQNLENQLCVRFGNGFGFTSWGSILISGFNATVDGNGFIKAASPIVQLFANKIEMNDEAQQQNIEFEKLGTGDYLIKGSSGFSQDGWYIETPKDANGNLLVAVVYEQLENGDISVKTYDYMLNRKGRIVADIETPLDIPENRWIDLRLQELPQPEVEVTDDPEQ